MITEFSDLATAVGVVAAHRVHCLEHNRPPPQGGLSSHTIQFG